MRLLSVLAAVALLLAPAGCSSSARSGSSSLPIYLIGVESKRLEVVQREVPTEDSETAHARAVAAVKALMEAEENGKTYSSLWGRTCGLGSGVRSIESRPSEARVVVTLAGQGAAACDLSQEGYDLQVQQLVWTVVTNLDVAESTSVRVMGPDDYVWVESAVADRTYLADAARP